MDTLENAGMTFWEYVLLFAAAAAGGISAFLIKKEKWALVQLLIAFSGAYLLGLAVVHLIPGLYSTESLKNPGLWILAGFTLQLLLEPLSKGIEHGHFHPIKSTAVWPVMFGLVIHAFLEGMPLSGYQAMEHAAHHHHQGNQLLWGILIHKAPAAFALGSLLRLAGMRTKKILFLLLIFALASPAGALLSTIVQFSLEQFFFLLAMVTGSFLHLSTSILFESGEGRGGHEVSWKKFAAIVLGFTMAVLTTI